MLMELFGLIVSVVFIFVLFLRHIVSTERGNGTKSQWSRLQEFRDVNAPQNQPLQLSRDVIFAMVQRGVYSLNTEFKTDDGGDEVHRWTQELIKISSSKLETCRPNVLLFTKMANDLLDIVEKIIEEYEDNICELNYNLDMITETHLSIKKEIHKLLCQENIKATPGDNCHQNWITPVPSMRCHITADSQADDNFLTTLDQFEKSRGIQ